MPYKISASNGRTTMYGTTTEQMWALIRAGELVGRPDFIEPFWEELVRVTVFSTARWDGHGTTEHGHIVAVSPLTREWSVTTCAANLDEQVPGRLDPSGYDVRTAA